LGIKIMMPPEAMSSVAGILITKQVLGEIVRTAVRTPLDEHYFAVVMHKGVQGDLQRLSFKDLAKILSCSTSKVHRHVADHMVKGSARGGCKFCSGASRELKELIVEEKKKNHGSDGPFSLFIALSGVSSARRRHATEARPAFPISPRFPA
jgi:hypothetical protein